MTAIAAMVVSASVAHGQQPARQAEGQARANPEVALGDALSAACRQDAAAFAAFLTSDNAVAYRALPERQRTEFMKRIVLLEDPGRPLLSNTAECHLAIRCASPGVTIEMRLGEIRLRDNLAFIPMEIPLPNEPPRSVTLGLVREGGDWKLLSVGLMLLDVPSMAKHWEQADLEAREDNAIAALRKLATALETYRRAYGKLPESLELLGMPVPVRTAADPQAVPSPSGGISPEAAGLVDSELAAGNAGGYTIRYRIVPASGNMSEEEGNQAAKFELAATPKEYGKTGQRSFFLDSTGVLRGGDKRGAVAVSTDPRIGPV